MILTFTGASGTGKTTTVRRLLGLNPKARPLTSTTTRAPRQNDIPGEYEFIDDEEFLSLKASGKLAWWTFVRGRQYGTRRVLVDLMLDSRDQIALATLDQSGVSTLTSIAKERGLERNLISIYFLSPGETVLRERLQERREPDEMLEKNIAMCRHWDTEAKASLIPFRFFQDDNKLEDKVNFALRLLSDT